MRTESDYATAKALIDYGFKPDESWRMAICANKMAYRTRKEAHRKAQHYEIEFYHKQVPYKCNICGQWHLRTKEPKNAK